MELIVIIFLLWLIGCAFPGSGQSYGPSFGEVCAVLVGAALLIALVPAWTYSMIGIVTALRWLGVHEGIALLCGMFGPIAIPMIVASLINAATQAASVRSEE